MVRGNRAVAAVNRAKGQTDDGNLKRHLEDSLLWQCLTNVMLCFC
jgi:hypothetical protein